MNDFVGDLRKTVSAMHMALESRVNFAPKNYS